MWRQKTKKQVFYGFIGRIIARNRNIFEKNIIIDDKGENESEICGWMIDLLIYVTSTDNSSFWNK